MTDNKLSLESLSVSLEVARVRWASVNGYANDAQSDDLNKARKMLDAGAVAFAVSVLDNDQQGAFLDAIAQRLPVKAIMRAGEMFNRLGAGQGCDRTTLLAVSGALVGATSRSAVAYTLTGKGDENTSDHVPNVNVVNKLRRVFGAVGVTTVSTQLSRSFGKNGFCNVLGMGSFDKGAKGTEPQLTINPKNALVKAIKKYAESASEQTLKLNQGKKGE